MPEKRYEHQTIETKWHGRWAGQPLYRADAPEQPKYYLLEMLPYPSGKLHMGHVRNYSIGDTLARYMWMRGYNVLHPMGWDAFGLPAENAAIKNNVPPRDWTLSNIAAMKRQMERLAFGYDWDREIATCDPEYYRWNQWLFLKMLERGLAYRKHALVNWCPECGTVLANEQVVDGCCWRHETTPVEQRALQQWFLRITDYAGQLLDDLETLKEGWPERVISMQRNWIGRSIGAEVDFTIEGGARKIRIFTTRIDTIFGASCVLLSPQHPLAAELIHAADQPRLKAMIDAAAHKDPGDQDKVGFATPRRAINPFNGELVEIWIANFVLLGYGTGAIMAVPAHDERDFEFCAQYGLPVRTVIVPQPGVTPELPFTGEGFVQASGPWTGQPSDAARENMSAHALAGGFGDKAITYRIKDWGISRQRYWGTPIPVVHCESCGVVPVPLEQLPVILPLNVNISGKGRSPLLDVPEFMTVSCPKCGGAARRESDTMDTFVDSSWYFYRYADAHNRTAPFDPEKIAAVFPIDQYIGGVTHAVLHLIYSRFWTKVMRDLGLIANDEPVRNLFTQGMVLMGGKAMSKSRGNVVSPDDMVEKYGADTCRLYVLFAAPPDKDMDWDESSVEGQHRFLSRLYRFVTRNLDRPSDDGSGTGDRQALRKLHQTLQKITGDFDNRWHFNTSIAALMELLNELQALEKTISTEALGRILPMLALMLGPFAPYIAQEMWEDLGRTGLVFRQSWPAFDAELAREDEAGVVVQVNGKVRGRLSVPFGTGREELERLATSDLRVRAFLDGKQIVKIVVVPDKLVNIVVR